MKMGNNIPIAFGGATLGVAINAAYSTVPEKYKLYSVVGHFLGPTSLDQVLRCKVTRTRDTKSFATRRIEVSQMQKSGDVRVVVELTADFHIVETGIFEYSAPPTRSYSDPAVSFELDSLAKLLIKEGKVTAKQFERFKAIFEGDERFFERRFPPESMATQNLNGMAKAATTTQDHLPITARSSADWYRIREDLSSEKDQIASLLFLMDEMLSSLPLAHTHQFVDDVGACSTLDFAIRVFRPEVNLKQWHLCERTTSAAGYGRTFSEGRLWNEEGHMVASVTQQGIMRPKNKARGNL